MSKKDAKTIKYPYSRLKGLQQFFDCICVQEPDWKIPKVDAALFRTLDMAKGKEGAAVNTLLFLGLIDDKGVPTDKFHELRKDYKTTLKGLVMSSYGDLFGRIPPRMINQTQLVKFFGPPVDTAEYQAKLFVWLCGESGIDLPSVEKQFHRGHNDKEDGEVTE